MAKRVLVLGSTVLALAAAALPAALAADAKPGARFEWTTGSAEAKQTLVELQQRIENFQFGPQNVEIAQKIVAADPQFALGVYYLSAVTPQPEALAALPKWADNSGTWSPSVQFINGVLDSVGKDLGESAAAAL